MDTELSKNFFSCNDISIDLGGREILRNINININIIQYVNNIIDSDLISRNYYLNATK